MKRRYLLIVLSLLIMSSMSTTVFAHENSGHSSDAKSSVISSEDGDSTSGAAIDVRHADKEVRDEIKAAAKDLKEQKQELRQSREELKDQIEAAVEAGDTALTAKLKEELAVTETSIGAIQVQFRNMVQERRELVRANYTNDEINEIGKAEKNIEDEDSDATVLSFDSVFSNAGNFKFDTPPVIRDGRTLVPIRAITEGFGADVSYVDATKTVTITKGDTVISFVLGSDTATVNGAVVPLDTKAGITNNRTYVPLRFVMEALKLDVQWDDDTKTIEIDDPSQS